MPKKINRIGSRFHKLLVIDYAKSEQRKDGHGSFSRWKCLCDCGNQIIVRANNLVSGTTKSCGCLSLKVPQRQPKGPRGRSGFLRTLRGYKFSAKKRNHDFSLSEKEFYDLTQQRCHYCGTIPNKIMSTGSNHSEFCYNGLDRVDNNLGYSLDNCVPCCETCNKAKHTKTYEEFLSWINAIIIFRKSI